MSTNTLSDTPLFPLGDCYLTPCVSTLVEEQGLSIHDYLQRHQCGDWGCVPTEDSAENELSLKEGYRLLSAYDITLKNDGDRIIKIWIITEADRSYTTALLPEEY